MIPLATDEVRALGAGRLEATADVITGVKIDSRRVEPGDLFVVVGGGAAFLEDARGRGAAATLVPDAAHAALAALGRAVRERSGARFVAITGSVGKTTTKDILTALCTPVARTVAAEASYNAELGVPLTLCRVEADTEICVLEVAMRGLGQIAELAAIARPDVGVITSVGPAHLELVGTVADVARAKGELLEALPAGGIAIVPVGVPALDAYLRDDLDVRRFGPGADYRLEAWRPPHGVFDLRGRRLELALPVAARHHAENAVVALAAYDALDLPLDRAHEGAAAIRLSRWRGEEVELPDGILLINDAYNANPLSMTAALRHLAERAGDRRRVAVLGDMAELGADGPAYHDEIGRAAGEAGVEVLFAVGSLAARYVEAGDVPFVWWAESLELEPLVEALRAELQPGDVVLVKASRSVGLEAVAEALASVPA